MPTIAKIGICLIEDAFRWVLLFFRSTKSLQAENLFLRRQLALFLERGVRPRRVDVANRVSLRNRCWKACITSIRSLGHRRARDRSPGYGRKPAPRHYLRTTSTPAPDQRQRATARQRAAPRVQRVRAVYSLLPHSPCVRPDRARAHIDWLERQKATKQGMLLRCLARHGCSRQVSASSSTVD